ncbi:MAG: endolytic transglycosylase MltG [Sphingomicrobium sp.]
MFKGLIKLVVALAFLVIIIGGYLWWGPGPLAKSATVTIREGSTMGSAARDLAAAGAIRGRGWYYAGRVMGGGAPIQAGEFEIPAHASGAAVLDLLQHGRPVQRLITVSEGMPAIIVAEKLAALAYLTGPVPDIREGSVLPDSYGFERGEPRAKVVGRMQAAMTKVLASLWAARKGDCPVSTPQQAITLASIVEKETGKASERPTIAGVYCNRLKIGMKLDADPTVIYPVTKGKPLGRRILRSELNAITGYNTYRERGLPAGPITNPGRESIAAVLSPAPTMALYFVADGTGGHVFAETLAQHQANVSKWFKLRRERGEM